MSMDYSGAHPTGWLRNIGLRECGAMNTFSELSWVNKIAISQYFPGLICVAGVIKYYICSRLFSAVGNHVAGRCPVASPPPPPPPKLWKSDIVRWFWGVGCEFGELLHATSETPPPKTNCSPPKLEQFFLKRLCIIAKYRCLKINAILSLEEIRNSVASNANTASLRLIKLTHA